MRKFNISSVLLITSSKYSVENYWISSFLKFCGLVIDSIDEEYSSFYCDYIKSRQYDLFLYLNGTINKENLNLGNDDLLEMSLQNQADVKQVLDQVCCHFKNWGLKKGCYESSLLCKLPYLEKVFLDYDLAKAFFLLDNYLGYCDKSYGDWARKKCAEARHQLYEDQRTLKEGYLTDLYLLDKIGTYDHQNHFELSFDPVKVALFIEEEYIPRFCITSYNKVLPYYLVGQSFLNHSSSELKLESRQYFSLALRFCHVYNIMPLFHASIYPKKMEYFVQSGYINEELKKQRLENLTKSLQIFPYNPDVMLQQCQLLKQVDKNMHFEQTLNQIFRIYQTKNTIGVLQPTEFLNFIKACHLSARLYSDNFLLEDILSLLQNSPDYFEPYVMDPNISKDLVHALMDLSQIVNLFSEESASQRRIKELKRMKK